MRKTDKLIVKYNNITVGQLSLTPDNKLCAFEYDKEWLVQGFSISPLELPLKSGLFIAKAQPFYGNFGIFEDSLPDGYGRYLLHKVLLKEGINDSNLSSLDRLSVVGNGGMGALTYEPETIFSQETDICDLDTLQQKAFEVLREKNNTDAGLLLFNSKNSGGCRPKALLTDNEGHWMVKFRHTYDPENMGIQEYHYNAVAKRCGINVPDFKLIDGKYFASRRFDRSLNNERYHVATAGALLCVSLANPILDYSNLLALTGYITKEQSAVEEMFRRMIFNYLTDNKDDHCKNFSYLCKKDKQGNFAWTISPAYDLTLCTEGYNGEHATSINGTGSPTLEDIWTVGMKIKLTKKRCMTLFAEVRDNVCDLLLHDIH